MEAMRMSLLDVAACKLQRASVEDHRHPLERSSPRSSSFQTFEPAAEASWC